MRAPRRAPAEALADCAARHPWMDAASPGGGATADVSARRGKLEAIGKQMRFVFRPGDDANVARLGDEIAAAIPRPFGRKIAFLHTEGPALICNPVNQEQNPR